jgi:hypothetical protein
LNMEPLLLHSFSALSRNGTLISRHTWAGCDLPHSPRIYILTGLIHASKWCSWVSPPSCLSQQPASYPLMPHDFAASLAPTNNHLVLALLFWTMAEGIWLVYLLQDSSCPNFFFTETLDANLLMIFSCLKSLTINSSAHKIKLEFLPGHTRPRGVWLCFASLI